MAKRLKSKNLLDLAFVSDPQLGPDGTVAAAVVTRIERPKGEPPRYRSHIRIYGLEHPSERDFTRGANDILPSFSPDGTHLAYLSRQSEAKPQLTIIPLDGGEGRTLTDHRAGVTAYCWHPSGNRLAYLTHGSWHDAAADTGGGRTVTSRRYKLDGVGFLPTGPTDLRLIGLDGSDTSLESFVHAPTLLRYDNEGHLFIVAADEDDERDAIERGFSQIWRYSRKGKRGKGLLERSDLVAALAPAPDGNTVAFLAPADSRDTTGPTGLWTVAARGGRATLLSGDFETKPTLGGDSRYGRYDNTPVWNETGSALLVNLNIEGRSGLARIRLDGSRTVLQDEPRAVTAFAARAGRAVFTAETPDKPGEVFVRFKNGRERKVSHENDAFVERHELRPLAGPFQAAGDDETPVQYWALLPKRARKDGARVVEVHGGPHTNYGYGFYLEFQLLAAAGYQVVFGNPRGSSGQGSTFAQAMLGAYGSVDADDVMAICDAAESRFGGAPLHLTGGSYGGFMTTWLVGHSDRFTSAVTQRSISNWLSFYGSSDIGYRFADREIGGVPWEAFDTMWQQSPLKYAANIDTPLLILHAERDHRCPIEQAEQLFVALSTLDRAPSEFIRFPDEGHELSRSGRPDRRIERLDAMMGWFERHARRR